MNTVAAPGRKKLEPPSKDPVKKSAGQIPQGSWLSLPTKAVDLAPAEKSRKGPCRLSWSFPENVGHQLRFFIIAHHGHIELPC